MNDKIKRTIRAFNNLSSDEKKELLKSLRSYELKGSLEESVVRDASMIMGPLGTTCPYCGK